MPITDYTFCKLFVQSQFSRGVGERVHPQQRQEEEQREALRAVDSGAHKEEHKTIMDNIK